MQFSGSICVAIILAISKLEYLWTHKSWWAENLYSDTFWHEESEIHPKNMQKWNLQKLHLDSVALSLKCEDSPSLLLRVARDIK